MSNNIIGLWDYVDEGMMKQQQCAGDNINIF